jgi:outer membrane lipoprotein SlyB
MKSKSAKRKLAEAAVGVAVGGVVVDPIGALAGGLAAGHVESGLDKLARIDPREFPQRKLG